MNESTFLSFLNTTTSKGGTTFNLNTSTVSKSAVKILKESKYSMLAKQHINANIKHAYTNNDDFRDKLNEVMESLGITVIAPEEE